MSLRIWLPMTKDLRNQGLDDVTVTNNGATFNSAGKLGGCYNFDGTTGYLSFIINNIISLNNSFSVCSWVKIDGDNSYNPIFFFGTSTPNGSGTSGVSLHGPLCNRLEGSDGTHTIDKTFSTDVTANTWCHVTVTYNGAELKYYCNSAIKDSISWTYGFGSQSNIKIGSFWGPKFKGKMNDVRIYDHCLSPMEVKQLAQGLVLHYPLNRQGWGQENLATNTSFPNSNIIGYGGQKAIEYNHSDWTSGGRYFAGDSNSRLTFTEIQANQPYTISAWVYIYSDVTLSNPGGTTVFYRIYKTGDSPNYGYDIYFDLSGITERNKWIKVSKTFVSSYTYTYNQGGTFQIGGYNGHFKVSMPKVEKGSVATPWCPNSSDTLATITGLNSTTEYDCSGFCNNGTRIGTFTWTSDTPKYAVSQNCLGTNYIYLTSPSVEIQTIAVWVNWKAIPSGQSVILVDNGSGIGLGLASSGILCSTSGAGNSYTFSKANLVANTWYHFVVVKTGATTRKLYINGVEQTPTSNTSNWSYSVNQLQLGKRSTTSDGFVGKLSDFRAYATALSADDVKSLYQNAAYIDSSGNVYGVVHTEV